MLNRRRRLKAPVSTAGDSRIVHVGPDVQHPGGMATVINTLVEARVGGAGVAVASWTPVSFAARLGAAFSALATIARLAPGTVVHFHLSERGSFIREGMMIGVGRARGLSTVATLHGADFVGFAERHPRLVAWTLTRCDAILALSGPMESMARRCSPDSEVVRVVNPVHVEASPTAAGAGAPIVLFAGEVGLRKGVDVLLEAWPTVREQVPRATLRIIGPATEWTPPASEGVAVCPPLSRAQIRSEMKASRLVVLPSRAEALPMVLLEAMAMARPFVSTNVGDISLLTDHGAGLAVQVGDAGALADAIVRLLQEPASATEMGQRGRTLCQEQFSTEALSRKMTSVYANLEGLR